MSKSQRKNAKRRENIKLEKLREPAVGNHEGGQVVLDRCDDSRGVSSKVVVDPRDDNYRMTLPEERGEAQYNTSHKNIMSESVNTNTKGNA